MSSKNSNYLDTNFLLVDSTITITKIKQLKLDLNKIITFDIKSDRILSDNSMKHEISDNLVTNNELKLIDWINKSYAEK